MTSIEYRCRPPVGNRGRIVFLQPLADRKGQQTGLIVSHESWLVMVESGILVPEDARETGLIPRREIGQAQSYQKGKKDPLIQTHTSQVTKGLDSLSWIFP